MMSSDKILMSLLKKFLKVSKFQMNLWSHHFSQKYESNILGETMTSQIHSEIVWPLIEVDIQILKETRVIDMDII